MTDQELKKLNRNDLLQILLEQSREIEQLKERLARAEAALGEKSLKIDNAGSIAEAALQLNGIFEAAQNACKQYTDNIIELSGRQEQICARLEQESREKAEDLIASAEKYKANMEQETDEKCAKLIEAAQAESQAYWDDVHHRLEMFSAEHAELQQLLSVLAAKKQG